MISTKRLSQPDSVEHVTQAVQSIAPEAYSGLPGRFVQLYARSSVLAPETLLLNFLAWSGAYLGRYFYTRIAGEPVFANLYVVVIGQQIPSQIFEVFFDPFAPHPRIARTGIRKAEHLVFLIRDSMERSEKVYTRHNEKPYYMNAQVDQGVAERRLIVTQSDLVEVLSRRSPSAVSLRAALLDASRGKDLAVYLDYRSGGFLRATEPHVTIVATCRREIIASLPQEFVRACLFVEPKKEVHDFSSSLPEVDAEALLRLQGEFFAALPVQAMEVSLEPAALDLFNNLIKHHSPDTRAQAICTLARLGVIYALRPLVSNRSRTSIGVCEAAAAAAIFRHSASVSDYTTGAARKIQTDEIADRIESALRANPSGLTSTGLNRLFSGNLDADLIRTARQQLLEQGRARRDFVPSNGRPREIWYPGVVQ